MHSQQMFNECIARTGRAASLPTGVPHERARGSSSTGTPQATAHISPGALTDLPAANPKKEASDIALLLLRKLLEVLQGTHFACAIEHVSSSSPAEKENRAIDNGS